jgi:hypothetical protein
MKSACMELFLTLWREHRSAAHDLHDGATHSV